METRHGFTLIEAAVAFAILVVALIILFGVFARVRAGGVQSDTRLDAALLARSLLAQQRGLGFASLTPGGGSVNVQGTRDGIAYAQNLIYRVDVEAVDAAQKRVWATVTWNESTGGKRLVVETLVADL